MKRNNRTKSTKPTTYLRKDIGTVLKDKHPNNQQRATKHHDPMMEELERMSNDSKESSSHNEPGTSWLAIDRSRQVGTDCTWDGIAYMGIKESGEEKGQEYHQRRSGSTTSLSMIVERGSIA